ncbi:hypothetical protein BH23ACT5_BH23ACT5_09920 [soil metagenome]
MSVLEYGDAPDPRLGVPGGTWALDVPDRVPAVWGHGNEVAWSRLEPALIVGADGTGKTVVAFNIAVRLAGLVTEPLLGLPVLPRKRVLYLAQDRPRQAQRALRRMLGTMDRDPLNDALTVIDWPIDTVERNPEVLVELATANDADTVIVDSLKDITEELSSEATGASLKRAFALCVTESVDVLGLHHDRKAQDSKRRLLKLSDVYGSRLITAGCGSVLALNGVSGDPVIELRHLKQVVEEVGPMSISFNFDTGEVSAVEGTDLLAIVNAARGGITANDAARLLYQTDKPTRAEKERARRKLDSLLKRQLVVALKGSERNEPDRFCGVVTAPKGGAR